MDSLVVECDWWDEICIDPSTFGRTLHDQTMIRLTCVPAQHNSGACARFPSCTQ
jgi:hypothetical protein